MSIHLPLTVILRRYDRADGFTTIELRGYFPVVAFVILLLLYLFSTTEEAAMGVTTLGGILIFGYLWARAMTHNVTAERHLLSVAMQVGDELEEHVYLENTSYLPILWAEFVDRSDLPSYNVTSVRATEASGSRRWTARAICTKRGLYQLGPWELKLSDPFGIFLVRHTYNQIQEILVYPPLAPLPRHLLPASGSIGEHRPLRQALSAETVNAISTRPYQPGDSLRHLHWPTTARQAEPYVKYFEPEATSTVWIILDLDADVHLGTGIDSTVETMVILAASLAHDMLHRHLAVGLLACNEQLTVVAPARGQVNIWTILRALAPLNPSRSCPISQTLKHAQSILSPHHLAFVITPSLDTTWVKVLKHLPKPDGINIEAILLDPASFGGKGQAKTCAIQLAELGIRARIIRRGEIQPIEAAYGELRRWKFKILGTGRAVPLSKPRSVLQSKIGWGP
jgi:uncharacterized protein (DUF58 family)